MVRDIGAETGRSDTPVLEVPGPGIVRMAHYARDRKPRARPGGSYTVHANFRKETAMRRATMTLVTAALLLTGLVLTSPVAALEVGQKAPDFTLAAPGGKQVKLSDLTAKGPVVIFTFIQAFTGT